MIFNSLGELKSQLMDYVNWYNNKRIHSALNYMSPVKYRLFKMTE
jgi:transposase InsO family protein